MKVDHEFSKGFRREVRPLIMLGLWLVLFGWLGWIQKSHVSRDVFLATVPSYSNDKLPDEIIQVDEWVFDCGFIWNGDYFLNMLPCTFWFPSCGGIIVYEPSWQNGIYLPSIPYVMQTDTLKEEVVSLDSQPSQQLNDSVVTHVDSVIVPESRWKKWKTAWRKKWASRRENEDLF